MPPIASLLRRRPFYRRLWMAEVVSLLGDWMSFVAVSLLALREGGDVVALALVLVGHTLPHALLAPFAGVIADRLDRRRVMIGVNVSQSALTVAMAGAAALGHVGAVQLLVFARASVGAFLPPLQSAALRHVVEEDELLDANALTSMTWSVMFAAGMAAGGALASLGPVVALVADAASFAAAALLLRGLPAMPAPARAGAAAPLGGAFGALALVHRDMRAAWKHAWDHPALLDAVLAKTPVALAAGGAWVLLNLVADDVAFAGTGAVTLGVLQCVRGVGTGVGPAIGATLVRRGMAMPRAARLAAWTTFAGIAALTATKHWALLLAATFAWGLGGGSNWVLSSAEIQRLSPDRFIGRLAAIDNLAFTSAMCLAALSGASIVDRTGVHASAAWATLSAGVVAWAGLRWVLRARAARAPAAGVALAAEGAGEG